MSDEVLREEDAILKYHFIVRSGARPHAQASLSAISCYCYVIDWPSEILREEAGPPLGRQRTNEPYPPLTK
jgi:hypothetical protein